MCVLGLVWWGYVVGVFQGAVGGDTCINHAPSFSPPQELADVSFPPSHTHPRAGRWMRVESIMRRLETGSRESHVVGARLPRDDESNLLRF